MHGVYTYDQTLALQTIPVVTGSISFVSSGTIAFMIIRHKEKFSHPFHRLIFCLSLTDVIQSAAMILGPFSLPQEYDPLHRSNGTRFTCDLQGFALHLGFAGVPMYVLSLSIYYFGAVKYNISDKKFSKKIEPFLHAVAILWTFSGGIACWATGVFNVMRAGNVCWYTPLPDNCVTDIGIECIRGEQAYTFGWLFGGSNAITLCGIIFCLVGVCRTVIKQENRNERYSIRSVSIASDRNSLTRRLSLAIRNSLRRSENSENLPVNLVPALRHASYVSRSTRNSQRRRRETMAQASLYIVSFFASNVWAYLYGFLVTIGQDVPFGITLMFSIFYPLGGLFNILVYTRPKLISLKKRQPELSWIRCFFKIVKSGVAVPDIVITSERSEQGSSRMAQAMSAVISRKGKSKNLNERKRNSDTMIRDQSNEESQERLHSFDIQSLLTMDPLLRDSVSSADSLNQHPEDQKDIELSKKYPIQSPAQGRRLTWKDDQEEEEEFESLQNIDHASNIGTNKLAGGEHVHDEEQQSGNSDAAVQDNHDSPGDAVPTSLSTESSQDNEIGTDEFLPNNSPSPHQQ